MTSWSNEEDRLQRIEAAQASLWDWQTSHILPPARQSASRQEWAQHIYAYIRHFDNDPTTPTNIYFNMVQCSSQQTALRHIQVGPHPPSSHDNAMYMAYYAESANWRGSPFHVTILSNRALQSAIEGPSPSGQYQLDQSIAAQWKNLENLILPIINALRNHVFLPYALDYPRNPSQYHYQHSSSSRSNAYESARQARNMFRLQAALLAFLVSFWSRPGTTRPMHLLARWLSTHLRIDFEQTATLLSSPPISHNAPGSVVRRGMTISLRSPYLPYLPIFLDCNIPVIVELEQNYLSIVESAPDQSIFRPLLHNALPYVAHGHCCTHCDARLQELRDDTCTHTDPLSFVVEREHEWLANCVASKQPAAKLVNGDSVTQEWGTQLTSKLRRFALYEWVGERGNSTRCPIDSTQFPYLIKAYDLRSRYVSILHREVDFFPGISAQLEPEQGGFTVPTEEGEIPDAIMSPLTHEPTTSLEPWSSILHKRLGYTASGLHPEYPAHEDDDINYALRFLGLSPASWKSQMSFTQRQSCVYVAQTLSNPARTLFNIPAQFDIATGNVLQGLQEWKVERLVYEYQHTDPQTKQTTTHTGYRYAISTRIPSQHYFVVVDAPTLLEVARSECRGIVDIVATLTRRGIPCSTARYFTVGTEPKPRAGPRDGQGVIQDRKAFSDSAYRAYEVHRDNLFLGRVGGLALKEGGVVARIARGVLCDINPALTTPSNTADRNGRALGKNRQGMLAISDTLHPADLDAILGRYLNFKGTGPGDQESATLWPSASAWDASFLNTGAWNEEAEAWFLKQLQRWRTPILQRQEGWNLKLKTNHEWRHSMKGKKTIRETWKRYSKLATDYVSRHIP